MTNKKRLALLTASVLTVMALAVLCIIIKSFWINALLHIFLRLLCVPLMVVMIQRCFREQLTHSMKKALVLCGMTLTLDLVVIDAVRFILSNGVSTILFFPACLPACFMIVMLLSAKDTGRGAREKSIAFLVGIPLLLLSAYFEIYSFVQI